MWGEAGLSRCFPGKRKIKTLPEAVQTIPLFYQGAPGRAVPILFKISVALLPLTGAVVMAEAAFQGLEASSMQFAALIG